MERSADVEATVLDFYAAMGRGDADAVTKLLSADLTTVVGTDDDEWWEGCDIASAAFAAQLEAAGQLGFEAGSLRGYSVGDFGWFEDRAGVALDYGDSLAVRITGVVRRQDDQWRVVQMHVSLGTPNAEVGLTDLPV